MSRQRALISRLGSLAATQLCRAETALTQQGTASYNQMIYGRECVSTRAAAFWRNALTSHSRGYASGGGEEVVHEGLKLHATGGWHKMVGTTMSSVMWFWVFYRLYHDYEGFLFGHAQHFEHELHDHGDHDDSK